MSALLLAGCLPPAAQPKAPRERIESLWDLAPKDASAGLVAQDGAFPRMLALVASLQHGAARAELDKQAERRHLTALPELEGWAPAGLDASQGAAAFAWPEKKRGLLLVLPVSDRALFRKALGLASRVVGDREVDELGDGYLCAPAVGRYLCARSLEDLDAAAARHGNALAPAVSRLSPDDRGDVELYADARAPEVARLAEQAVLLGHLTAVAAALRLRADGASGRLHVLGETTTPLAKSLSGAVPPPGLAPTAAGAPTVVRLHIDLTGALQPATVLDPLVRSELVEQLTGDLEVTTSGQGLAGGWAVAPVKDAARVEAEVKKLCADTGGSKRRYALGRVTVTEHGCAAVFDPAMLLLPVTMTPLPLAAFVAEGRLVVTVGDAVAPTAAERSATGVAEGVASWALADAEALVAFTRSPWIGPDVGAGAAFKGVVSLLDQKRMTAIDAFNELAAHVAQALVVARVADDGVILAGDVVTFAGDPPAARAAHEAALVLRASGDLAGYRASLARVEQLYPGTLAAQRAAVVRAGGPFLGAGVLLLGALGDRSRKSK